MFLSKFFKSKRKDKYERDDYEEEQAQTRYASLDEEKERPVFVAPELRQKSPTEFRDPSSKHYVVDLCEQMIDVSQQLEDTRSEYEVITNYLNDIQALEEMTEEQKAPLVDFAKNIDKLNGERSEFLETERKISESEFNQMQESESELPGIIKRLKSNETYLDAIRKDLSYLEGEKLEWEMVGHDSKRMQKLMRKLSFYLLAIYVTAIIFVLVLQIGYEIDTRIPMIIATAAAAIAAVLILVRYQDSQRDEKRSEVNRNHAISLENHVKIKYVNIKNAVDYTCERFHTKGWKDLANTYELYQEEVRNRNKLQQTNDDLEYYSNELVNALKREQFYDSRVWLSHANAIIDSRELVELKHELIGRRQKLRGQIEYHINTLTGMKKEVMRFTDNMGPEAAQINQILRKIEQI